MDQQSRELWRHLRNAWLRTTATFVVALAGSVMAWALAWCTWGRSGLSAMGQLLMGAFVIAALMERSPLNCSRVHDATIAVTAWLFAPWLAVLGLALTLHGRIGGTPVLPAVATGGRIARIERAPTAERYRIFLKDGSHRDIRRSPSRLGQRVYAASERLDENIAWSYYGTLGQVLWTVY